MPLVGQWLDVAGNAVTLGAVLAFAIPALRQYPRRLQRSYNQNAAVFYKDLDGTATEESNKAYSDLVPRLTALASIALGLSSSIASALLLRRLPGSAEPSIYTVAAAWLMVASWALVCLQWTSLPIRGHYNLKFRLVTNGLISSLCVGVAVSLQHGYAAIHDVIIGTGLRLLGAAYLLQILAAIGAVCSFGAVQRRPDVYLKSQLVDQQFTVSLLSRLSFSWNRVVFDISKQRQLQLADIPQLGFRARSRTVHHQFRARKTEGRLWLRLVKAHTRELAEQWVLTFVIAGLSLFPQLVLYNFLDRIERRRDYTVTDPALFVWIFGLFLSIVLAIGFTNWLGWITTSRLEIPVASMLQTLVFRKALNQYETTRPPQKEDIGAGTAANEEDGAAAKDPKAAEDAKKAKKGGKPRKDGEEGPDVQQSVINHMKLDSNRITMFCTFNNNFPSAVFKLGLAGTFLVRLIGWKAFFGGLLSAALMIPLTIWTSKKFRVIQFGLMRYRDGKAHVLEEALQGMRQIKYSALEQHWQDKILKARNEELGQFWRASLFMCGLMFIFTLGPLLLSCVALSIYAWEAGPDIRASVIFTSIGLFGQVNEAVALLPVLQTFMMEAWTSCTRLEKYLSLPDKPQIAKPGDKISMDNATVAWPKLLDPDGETEEPEKARSMLRDVSLAFPTGDLSIITGKTGSGKSLLLAAILGEVKLLSGTITFPAALEMPEDDEGEASDIPEPEWILPSLSSFVSQTPWIEGGTVRENVLFGLPFVESRYQQVVHACALERDIELLVDGDKTEVGPKGVTLSGGQRWRLALARALYSRAGIIVLDDVLSAVDAHVGRRLVDEALTGPLARGRTRILATHHAELCLPHASYLVTLHNGKLESAKALQPNGNGHSLGSAYANGEASIATATANGSTNGTEDGSGEDSNGHAAKAKKDGNEEQREIGQVKWRVYREYLRASGGILLWGVGVGVLITSQLIGVAMTWSLKELSETAETENLRPPTASLSVMELSEMQQFALLPSTPRPLNAESRYGIAFWLSMYVGLYLLSSAISVAQTLAFFTIGLTAAKVFFERMTYAVLRAPLRWVDTVPAGRILNRFTTDTFTLDRRTVEPLAGFLRSIMMLVVVIGASLSVSGWVIVFGFLLSVVYASIAKRFIVAAREVKRINSICHSPIYDQFSSVLNGLSTIRAYHRTGYYMTRMFGLIDDSTKGSWALTLSNLWMRFRMGLLGGLFVTAVAVAVTLSRVDAALAGFSLTFAFGYTNALTSLLSAMTSMELGFNAAERVLEYAEITTEAQDGTPAPAAWPTEGRIEIENLTVGYAPDLPAVLRGLTFSVAPGERVGIVGRTGAGKSTLGSVLFRLLEPREGSVRIDGLDIATLRLEQLRSRLAIIPQDPFLFSGTLRSNLDPQGMMDDGDIQAVLRRVQLVAERFGGEGGEPAAAEPLIQVNDASTAQEAPASDVAGGAATTESNNNSNDDDDSTNIFTKLSTPISTGGSNLSQGQRQLVCLARALLAHPKIVVLDEATSAVDRGTDAAIQASLREAFAASGCTVLVIAHRLSTVADFDKVLVLEGGMIAEMGAPAELLNRGRERAAQSTKIDDERQTAQEGEPYDGTGAFWELVQKSGEKDKLLEMILGEGAVAPEADTSASV